MNTEHSLAISTIVDRIIITWQHQNSFRQREMNATRILEHPFYIYIYIYTYIQYAGHSIERCAFKHSIRIHFIKTITFDRRRMAPLWKKILRPTHYLWFYYSFSFFFVCIYVGCRWMVLIVGIRNIRPSAGKKVEIPADKNQITEKILMLNTHRWFLACAHLVQFVQPIFGR